MKNGNIHTYGEKGSKKHKIIQIEQTGAEYGTQQEWDSPDIYHNNNIGSAKMKLHVVNKNSLFNESGWRLSSKSKIKVTKEKWKQRNNG